MRSTSAAFFRVEIPFSPLLTGWNPDLGLLLILAFSGISVLAVLLAGAAILAMSHGKVTPGG